MDRKLNIKAPPSGSRPFSVCRSLSRSFGLCTSLYQHQVGHHCNEVKYVDTYPFPLARDQNLEEEDPSETSSKEVSTFSRI